MSVEGTTATPPADGVAPRDRRERRQPDERRPDERAANRLAGRVWSLAAARGDRPGQALRHSGRPAGDQQARGGARRRRRELQRQGGRDARPGGGVGLRQDDARQGHPAPPAADVGARQLRGQVALRPEIPRDEGRPTGHPGRLPGPLCEPQPAHERRRDRGRRALRAWHDEQEGARVGGPRPPQAGRAQPAAHPPLPARVQRWPAAAHRHCARARPAPEVHRVRRAGQRARRVDPVAGAQPAERPPGRVPAHVPVHRSQPGGGEAPLDPGRRHVPRQAGRAV